MVSDKDIKPLYKLSITLTVNQYFLFKIVECLSVWMKVVSEELLIQILICIITYFVHLQMKLSVGNC